MVALNASASGGRYSEHEKAPRSKKFRRFKAKNFSGTARVSCVAARPDFYPLWFLYNLQFNIEVWLSLVERCVRDAEAVGSSPVTSTKKKSRESGFFFLYFSLFSKLVKIIEQKQA